MKRLILLLFLVTSVALAGKNPRAEKAEERAERLRATPGGMILERPAVSYWDTLAINTSDLTCTEIYAMGGGVIWVNGYTSTDDVLLRSTDNGATWVTTTMAFTQYNEYALAPRDGNVAIAATGNYNIYRTTNGGTTWDSVYTYGGQYWDGIKFAGGDTVIAVGDAFDATGLYVVMSTDAGVTWTRFTNLPTAEVNNGPVCSSAYCQCIDIIGRDVWIAVYWGAGAYPQVLHSTDLGASWSTAEIPLGGTATTYYRVRSINMVDKNVGWVSRYKTTPDTRCFVHKTTDGGATWSDTIRVDANGNVVMSVKPMRGTNNLLAIGFLGGDARAWWSPDGGATWAGVQPPVKGDNGDMFNGTFVSTSLGYIVGDYRAMVFTPPTSSVEQTGGGLPSSFVLHQNYPNPFNPSTLIEYSIPKEGMVTLKVYNVLGQEVANLVQAHQGPGTYRVSFDARTLPSGTYIYTITAGGFTDVKKMLLIK